MKQFILLNAGLTNYPQIYLGFFFKPLILASVIFFL